MIVELKKQILQHIPDVETLSSIVHASPVMHQVYIMDRRQILTQVTINEMLGKGVSSLRCITAYGKSVYESHDIREKSACTPMSLPSHCRTGREITDSS